MYRTQGQADELGTSRWDAAVFDAADLVGTRVTVGDAAVFDGG
jgi:hypothetical protein